MQHMLHSLLAGQPIQGNDCISVTNPYDQTVIGNVTVAQADHTHQAIETALEQKETLTRYQRFEILDQSRRELLNRKEEFAQLITSEAGLCMRETLYEVGRACDVLQFSAMESPQG